MVNYNSLVATIFNETFACQDPKSSQSLNRRNGKYGPFGPHIPDVSGSYPTTELAMGALAELADAVRENDPALRVTVGRDAMRQMTSEVFGAHLQQLAREPDPSKRWKSILRQPLLDRARSSGRELIHYIPVWLFVSQECRAFEIGPVKFVKRAEWLLEVQSTRGARSSWMATTEMLWAGKVVKAGSVIAGLRGAWRSFKKGSRSINSLVRSFSDSKRFSEPSHVANGRTMSRVIHPDQWVACARITGFEPLESRRRGLLASQVALDTVRLALVRPSRGHIYTSADIASPRAIDRLNQMPSHDLAHGSRINMPGVSGAPGLAEAILDGSKELFEAAGLCINSSSTTLYSHPCPILAERWFNAVHWFGRACTADADFVAVVMLVIALDVLSGGLQDDGITELIARLTGIAKSQALLTNGTTLEKLVGQFYSLRSEVAHGSILAVHRQLDEERASLEDLTAAALDHYVVQLQSYGLKNGVDDRDQFLASLPPVKP